ncbi:MAG: HD-GYP domain-containing protein [candidate division WOR-3 bacterium]
MVQKDLLKNRREVPSISEYIKRFFVFILIPLTTLIMSLIVLYSFKVNEEIANRVFRGIKERAEIVINESIRSMVNPLIYDKDELISFYMTVYSNVVKELQRGKNFSEIPFEDFKEIFKKTFHQDLFEDINFYVISKEGQIIWTDYQPDLGLDLSRFTDFWQSLNVALERESVVFHFSGIEVTTGKIRGYLYKRLPDGKIFEIGILINNLNFYEAVKNLKKLSIFIEKIGLYNIANLPILPEFPPFPERHPRAGLYKRELIGEIEIEDFPPYKQRLKLYVILNFYSIFKIVIFTFLSFIVYLLVLIILAYRVQRFSSRELKIINKAISVLHEEQKVYVDPGLSKVQEVGEIIKTLNAAINSIDAEKQENMALIKELKESFYDFAERLAMIAEGYDPETGEHIRRVKTLTRILVSRLDIPDELKEDLVQYSVLHDVGKVYIPLSLLTKPGPLTPEEWELMKQHTVFAQNLLAHPRFALALEIALYHHENYDGTGYPFGLAGESIPLPGRIMKIIDVYDALRSQRPYKKAFKREKAIDILLNGDNRTRPEHFDPTLLKIFLEEIEKIDESTFYF